MTDDADLGAILGLWAHPDDETYLSGGLMAMAAAEGRRVVCVTATKGEAGFADDDLRDGAERMAVRAAEAAASLRILGVREHQWLGYPDGGCADVPDLEPVTTLTDLIDEFEPDTVLTFGPDGMTGHDDHVAVSRWATVAVRAARHRCRLLYATKSAEWNQRFSRDVALRQIMMVDGTTLPEADPHELAVQLRLTGRRLDQKVKALRAQQSQTESLRTTLGDATFRAWVADEYFRVARPDDWPSPTR